MKSTKDKENNEKRLMSAEPANDPNICKGCLKPRVLCACKSAGGPGSGGEKGNDGQRGEMQGLNEKTMPLDPQTGLRAMQINSRLSGTTNDDISDIEILLRRAKNMGLDPQKLLRNEGINIEQKSNIEELQKLAQNGDKMAKELYEIAETNVKGRSKLASKHLESAKNPYQTKNTKDK
ncbi:MAG: hypothetical protein BGO43_15235 [Gammaproteobacteria bacterium 39-13]|nr:hypothetical protein [Gammaproteobacteria bacterium]OJV87771.1 MAG: hypothetical protein BGO43_15235 [Gammaproteobacteria bacterium 39-13]